MTPLLHSQLQRWPHHILKCRMNSLVVHRLNHMNKRSKGKIADWERGGENKQTLAFWFTPQRLKNQPNTFLKGGKNVALHCRWLRNNLYICRWFWNVLRVWRLRVFLTAPNIIQYSWQPRLIALRNTTFTLTKVLLCWNSTQATLCSQSTEKQPQIYSALQMQRYFTAFFPHAI